MDAAIVELLPQAAGNLVAVEHQNHLGVGKGGPAAEGVHQPLPGGGQVPVRQGVELVPVEDDVVPIHHIVPLADLPQAGVRQRFPLFRSPVQGAAFAQRGTSAIEWELSCQDSYSGDALAVLTDFLNSCTY